MTGHLLQRSPTTLHPPPTHTHALQALWRSGPLLFDVCLLLLMAAATCLLTSYAAKAGSIQPQPAYDVYDAATTARARWLLPHKADVGASSAGGLPHPGMPGRWALPDDGGGDYEAWAELMQAAHTTSRLWTAHGVVQGVVLVLLVARQVGGQGWAGRLWPACLAPPATAIHVASI